jgi:VanZ family protein/glutaredoxin
LKSALRAAGLWVPVLAYGGLVYYLSSLSVPPVAGRIPDYLAHPAEYLGLTFLLVRALTFGFQKPLSGRIQLGALVVAVIYAISDEIHQLHVPRRTASFKDVLSDTLGAVLALGAAEVYQRITRSHLALPLRVTLYTRPDCHLCHEARQILSRAARELDLEFSEVNVDSDPGLASLFSEQVPVILAGEAKISKCSPDEAAIRRRLFRLAPRRS